MTSPRPAGSTTSDVFHLSWELFGELCRVLALRVAEDFDPELVIGIARAGVLPAAVIASILRVDFHCMKISRREGDELVRTEPRLFTTAPREAAGRRVLLVDEITTSGATLRLALSEVRDVEPAEVRTATSFTRPGGYAPDYHALETEALIVFPWDRQVLADRELVVHPMYRDAVVE